MVKAPPRVKNLLPFYYGWFVVALSFLANLTAAGWVRVQFGDYQYAFIAGGFLGLLAACLALTVNRGDVVRPELPAATELAEA